MAEEQNDPTQAAPAPPELPESSQPEPGPFADLPEPMWDLIEKGGKPDDYETR